MINKLNHLNKKSNTINCLEDDSNDIQFIPQYSSTENASNEIIIFGINSIILTDNSNEYELLTNNFNKSFQVPRRCSLPLNEIAIEKYSNLEQINNQRRKSDITHNKPKSILKVSSLMSKKYVSFADDVGGDLVTVHSFCESLSPCISKNELTDTSSNVIESLVNYKLDKIFVHQDSLNLNKKNAKKYWTTNDCEKYEDSAIKLPVFVPYTKLFPFNIETDIVKLTELKIQSNVSRQLLGKIVVSNLAYEKKVYLRLTFNNWSTYNDYECKFEFQNNEGKTDVYSFTINITGLNNNSFIELCILYKVNNQTYWDNNNDYNYKFYV